MEKKPEVAKKIEMKLAEEYALMTEADVEREIGKHRKTLLRWASEGRFPKPISLGEKSRAWIKAEIQVWISEKKTKRHA